MESMESIVGNDPQDKIIELLDGLKEPSSDSECQIKLAMESYLESEGHTLEQFKALPFETQEEWEKEAMLVWVESGQATTFRKSLEK